MSRLRYGITSMIVGTRFFDAMSGSHSFAASFTPSGIGIQQSSVSVYLCGKRVTVFNFLRCLVARRTLREVLVGIGKARCNVAKLLLYFDERGDDVRVEMRAACGANHLCRLRVRNRRLVRAPADEQVV